MSIKLGTSCLRYNALPLVSRPVWCPFLLQTTAVKKPETCHQVILKNLLVLGALCLALLSCSRRQKLEPRRKIRPFKFTMHRVPWTESTEWNRGPWRYTVQSTTKGLWVFMELSVSALCALLYVSLPSPDCGPLRRDRDDCSSDLFDWMSACTLIYGGLLLGIKLEYLTCRGKMFWLTKTECLSGTSKWRRADDTPGGVYESLFPNTARKYSWRFDETY